MKTDLAPKHLYTSYLIAVALGLIIISIIHQWAMNLAVNFDNLVPFISTTAIWGMLLLGLVFIFNKCRYLIVNLSDDNYYKIGNLVSNSIIHIDNVTVMKKIFGNIFEIKVGAKSYYIFSSDKNVSDFKNYKH